MSNDSPALRAFKDGWEIHKLDPRHPPIFGRTDFHYWNPQTSSWPELVAPLYAIYDDHLPAVKVDYVAFVDQLFTSLMEQYHAFNGTVQGSCVWDPQTGKWMRFRSLLSPSPVPQNPFEPSLGQELRDIAEALSTEIITPDEGARRIKVVIQKHHVT